MTGITEDDIANSLAGHKFSLIQKPLGEHVVIDLMKVEPVKPRMQGLWETDELITLRDMKNAGHNIESIASDLSRTARSIKAKWARRATWLKKLEKTNA